MVVSALTKGTATVAVIHRLRTPDNNFFIQIPPNLNLKNIGLLHNMYLLPLSNTVSIYCTILQEFVFVKTAYDKSFFNHLQFFVHQFNNIFERVLRSALFTMWLLSKSAKHFATFDKFESPPFTY